MAERAQHRPKPIPWNSIDAKFSSQTFFDRFGSKLNQLRAQLPSLKNGNITLRELISSLLHERRIDEARLILEGPNNTRRIEHQLTLGLFEEGGERAFYLVYRYDLADRTRHRALRIRLDNIDPAGRRIRRFLVRDPELAQLYAEAGQEIPPFSRESVRTQMDIRTPTSPGRQKAVHLEFSEDGSPSSYTAISIPENEADAQALLASSQDSELPQGGTEETDAVNERTQRYMQEETVHAYAVLENLGWRQGQVLDTEATIIGLLKNFVAQRPQSPEQCLVFVDPEPQQRIPAN